MRIRRLDLVAFGPFTDRQLDLADGQGRLEVVYGSNESGKSTTLRALGGLLFGIDARTPDAHLHPYDKLRIGGVLVGASGAELEVVRRKGRVATLRDRDGEPVDDLVLKRFLHGVDADTFRALYGLDHQTLRLGAEALERAQGKVGESLFDAGLGGLGVARILAELGAEADALYTPLGRKKPVKESLALYAEATREGMRETKARAVEVQERGIEEARAVAQEAEQERRELAQERTRLERLSRALPHLARLRQLTADRSELGPVVLLAPEATRDRETALAALSAGAQRIESLRREIAEMGEERRPSAELAALNAQKEVIERLERLAALVESDLRGREASERAEAEATARLNEIETALPAVDIALGVAALSTRAHDLDRRLTQSRDQIRKLETDRAELDARRAGLERRLAELPPSIDTSGLQGAAEAATGMLDRVARIAHLREDLESLRARAESQRSRLGLFHGSLAALAAVEIPSLPPFAQAIRAHADTIRELEARARQAAKKLREHERDLDALRRQAAPLGEADLAVARGERDARWQELVSAAAPEAALFEQVRAAIDATDHIADRLRREVAIVERRARLEADREAASVEVAVTRAEMEREVEHRTATRERYVGAFRAVGIDPLEPDDMADWIHQARLAIDLLRQGDETERSLLTAEAERDAGADAVARAILGLRPGLALADLELRGVLGFQALLHRARALLAECERDREERTRIAGALPDQDAERARLDAQLKDTRTVEASSCSEWLTLTAALGIGADGSLDAVLHRISRVEAAQAARSDRDRAQAVLAEAAARAGDLERGLDLLLGAVPELVASAEGSSVIDRVRSLGRRLAAAAAEADAASTRQRILSGRRTALAQEESALIDARTALETLAARAQVSLPDLPLAEDRSRRAQEIDGQLAETKRTLLAACPGASVVELEAERARVGDVDLQAAIEELEVRVSEAESRRDRAHADAGGLEAGLRDLQTRSAGADRAFDAESHLATAAALLRRHVVARLAREVLEREVERYRESHQGPIVERASELMARLTLGRYQKLTVVYGERDRPELRCVRDGDEIGVDGLSDGTRDQLYLALRLATLERHAASAEPMPLVLDDIFVHFDDERTRAGIEVLAELAASMQVLLFTHHARVVELARSLGDALRLHIL